MAKAKKVLKEPVLLNQPKNQPNLPRNPPKPIKVAQESNKSSGKPGILSLIGDYTKKITKQGVPNVPNVSQEIHGGKAKQSKSKPDDIDLRPLVTQPNKSIVLTPVDVGAGIYDEIKITTTFGNKEETYSVDLFENDSEPVISSSYFVSKENEKIEIIVNFGWNWIAKNSNRPSEEIETKVKNVIVNALLKKFRKEEATSIANKIIGATKKQGGLKKLLAEFIKKSTDVSF